MYGPLCNKLVIWLIPFSLNFQLGLWMTPYVSFCNYKRRFLYPNICVDFWSDRHFYAPCLGQEIIHSGQTHLTLHFHVDFLLLYQYLYHWWNLPVSISCNFLWKRCFWNDLLRKDKWIPHILVAMSFKMSLKIFLINSF